MAAPIVPGPPPVMPMQPQQNTLPPSNQQMLRQAFLTELARFTSPGAQTQSAPQMAHSPVSSQITFIPLTATCAPSAGGGATTTSKSAPAKKKKSDTKGPAPSTGKR